MNGKWCLKHVHLLETVADLGAWGACPPPLSAPKFFLFHAIFRENLAKLYVGAPGSWRLLGKSWIRLWEITETYQFSGLLAKCLALSEPCYYITVSVWMLMIATQMALTLGLMALVTLVTLVTCVGRIPVGVKMKVHNVFYTHTSIYSKLILSTDGSKYR